MTVLRVFLLALAASAGAAAPLSSLAEMTAHIGETVSLTGRVSRLQWQRVISPPPGMSEVTYLDVRDGQTVLYSRRAVSCSGSLFVTGRVLAIHGAGAGSKIDDPAYQEVHLAAEEWRCGEP